MLMILLHQSFFELSIQHGKIRHMKTISSGLQSYHENNIGIRSKFLEYQSSWKSALPEALNLIKNIRWKRARVLF